MKVLRSILGFLVGILGLVLVVPAAALLLPFWLMATLSGFVRRFLEPTTLPWQQLIEFYPEVGWKPRANASAHALDYGGDTYQFTTDEDGWRGSGTIDGSDVVVVGDSHAFGCGVDDRHFFADLTENARVKAIGAPAYSMVQPVLWMEGYASALKGKQVVWLVCVGNDLDDNLHPGLLEYRAPFVRELPGAGGWEIVTNHVDPSRWTITSREGSMDSLIEICSSGHASERAFAAVDYLVDRAADALESVGARLTVMTIPELAPVARRYLERTLAASATAEQFDEDLPDRKFRRICGRHGVRFVALKDHLDSADYLENDFHWNPRGHRRVAELLDRLWSEAESEVVPRLSEDQLDPTARAAG